MNFHWREIWWWSGGGHPFPDGSYGKESAYNTGDLGLILGLGRSPGGRHGNPLQYSCLKNLHGERSLMAIVHGVAKSRTRLSN